MAGPKTDSGLEGTAPMMVECKPLEIITPFCQPLNTYKNSQKVGEAVWPVVELTSFVVTGGILASWPRLPASVDILGKSVHLEKNVTDAVNWG